MDSDTIENGHDEANEAMDNTVLKEGRLGFRKLIKQN